MAGGWDASLILLSFIGKLVNLFEITFTLIRCIMRKKLSLVLALSGWFAVIAQFFLMMGNRIESIGETTLRFFSFFTILTNSLVAFYFTGHFFGKTPPLFKKPGALTAITVYITVVGLVYQIALRHIWQPTGLQKVVDELLHTIIPLLVIIFWYLFEIKSSVRYIQILKWMIYPLAYLIFILIRGYFSGFYPYPFVSVSELGLEKVLLNSSLLLLVFLVIAVVYIKIGKAIK